MSTSEDEGGGTIPPENWIPHPVPDHGDLDRPLPVYAKDLKGAARSEFDAAVKAKGAEKSSEEPSKPTSRRSGKRRRGKGSQR